MRVREQELLAKAKEKHGSCLQFQTGHKKECMNFSVNPKHRLGKAVVKEQVLA